MTSLAKRVFVSVAMLGFFATPMFGQTDSNPEMVNSTYLVKDVKGTVLLWEPFATEWKILEVGMKPPGESLIQVRHDSYVYLKINNQKGLKGLGKADISFKINKPTIGRLNDQYLRQINIQKLFIDKLPDIKEIEKEINNPEPFVSLLDEAWNRIATVFSGDEIPIKALEMSAQNRPDQDFELSVKQKKIDILSPQHDATLKMDEPGEPIERFVYWTPPKDQEVKVTYDVFLWEKGTTRKEPIGTTTENKFKIELQPGVYQLQIVSKDKRYSSEVNTLTVIENSGLSDGLSGIKTKRDEVDEKDRLIDLVSPPDDFSHITRQKKASIFFSWENERDTEENRKFKLLVKTNTGKIVFKKTTYDRSVKVALKPGNYRWWVEAAVITDGQKSPIRSEARMLNVGKRKKKWISQLDGLLGKDGGIIYVDDK